MKKLKKLTIEVDGQDLNYFDTNDLNLSNDKSNENSSKTKPYLFFLHGLAALPDFYIELISILSNKYRVVSPFIYGFGHLRNPPKNLAACTELTKKFIHEFTSDSYVLVGQSFGGNVTIDLASKDSNVEKIILLSPGLAVKNPLEWISYILSTLKKDITTRRGEVYSLIRRPHILFKYPLAPLSSPVLYYKLFSAIANFDLASYNLSQDCLYLYGDMDAFFNVADFKDEIVKAMPNVKLHNFEGYSHDWSIYYPEIAEEIISKFL